jgi:hypothetical protein
MSFIHRMASTSIAREPLRPNTLGGLCLLDTIGSRSGPIASCSCRLLEPPGRSGSGGRRSFIALGTRVATHWIDVQQDAAQAQPCNDDNCDEMRHNSYGHREFIEAMNRGE